MNFHILGPLEVVHEGCTVDLGPGKQRALLALFLLHANEPLGTDQLSDWLWAGQPPATAAKTLHVHVSRLRKALGRPTRDCGAVVSTRRHGYELVVDPSSVDAHQLELLVSEGRKELALDHPDRAATLLERALALWRGPPLVDLAYESFAQRDIARLEDLRVATLEELIEAKLALGRHDEVLGELEAIIAEHPYRERPHAQLMLALYRCERQADALQAYHEVRRTLVEQLGIEPCERLRELEQAILTQAPELAIIRRDQDKNALLGASERPVDSFVEAELHDRVADLGDQLAHLHERLGEPAPAARARSDADAERRVASDRRSS